jgi:hypothetical protein
MDVCEKTLQTFVDDLELGGFLRSLTSGISGNKVGHTKMAQQG